MPTTIKFTSGDKVFWLGSHGFKKGIIKQVVLSDSVSISEDKKKRKFTKEIRYYLWDEDNAAVYMGDLVPENEIFTSYKSMLDYYSSKKI